MISLRRFFLRFFTSATRNGSEQRLAEEIEDHIARQAAENLRAGLSPTEAHRQAVLKFGGIEAIKEEYRDGQRLPFVETLAHDTFYAARLLRNAPAFTIAAALTLALGVGATTSIFTLVHALLLKSLPVTQPDQLYRLGKRPNCCVIGGYSQGPEFSIVSYELYKYFQNHTPAFEELAAFQADLSLFGIRRAQGDSPAESYFGEFVSGNYFTMFGVGAYAGRTLTSTDDRPNAPPAAMMSFRVWQQKWGSDPSVVGAVFNINNHPFTIAGITPPGFFGDQLRSVPPDFFLPFATEPLVKGTSSLLRHPDISWLDVMGRVRPGTNISAVQSQMRIELHQWLRSHLSEMDRTDRWTFPKQTLNLSPGGAGITAMREEYEHWLEILMLVSGFVLLIVCANVANLMLVRGMERRQQISLSMALGARPTRVVQQVLTESLALALLGGALGLAVAFAGTRLILHLTFPGRTAVPIDAAPSTPVLLFALGVSLLTGIVFGILPAWLATRIDPIEALRGANRTTREAGSLPRRTLVVVQAALSLVLLSASGLLLLALHHLEHQNFGFEQQGRIVINIDPVIGGYKPNQLDLLYRRIHDALGNTPGIAAVGYALYSPMSGNSWNEGVYIQGGPPPAPNTNINSWWDRVSPGYFDVIGNPIVRGRAITEQDTANSRHVAVVNEAFVRKFFPNQDPIGQHFGQGSLAHAGDYEIVGVVKDARYLNFQLEKPIVPFFFTAEPQSIQYETQSEISTEVRSHYLHEIVVRAQPGAHISDSLVRHALASVDPNLPITHIQTLSEQVAKTFNQQRLMARLTSLFGLLALALASIGIYGITAYNVGTRTSEIGVRMALGANPRSVIALVLRGAFALVALGLLVGVLLTFPTGRLLGNELYGIDPYDPAILLLAIVALALPAFFAAVIPALRASSISPMQALRAQ